ncbi:hypothetical protein YPPY13_2211, partial [Yersinia pestis PY-13]|jgi:protein kinase A
MKTS